MPARATRAAVEATLTIALGADARSSGWPNAAAAYEQSAAEVHNQAEILRRTLLPP